LPDSSPLSGVQNDKMDVWNKSYLAHKIYHSLLMLKARQNYLSMVKWGITKMEKDDEIRNKRT
jgi:hypothetical protein